MSNLLEKASILLTPTAYDDGKILSVKPEDGTGDFTFTRNSSATRVNSQGLIEDMQILSGELVSNGNFSQIGPEQIENGDFATDSDWTKAAGWTISGGTANATSAASGSPLSQYVDVGKTYKITYDVVSLSQGAFQVDLSFSGTALGQLVTTTGTFTDFITSINPALSIRAVGTTTGSITNVSAKEVGQDWSVTDSDANNYVVFNGSTARLKFLNTSPVTQLTTSFVMTAGKKYKLTVDVLTVTSGGIKIDGNGISETFNTPGITTRIINPTAASAINFYRATANVDITLNSVSLIEITDDTNLPRIDYSPYSGAGTCGHWLFEPQKTNLLTYSEQFDNASWINNGVTINANQVVSPDGALTADLLTGVSGGFGVVKFSTWTSTNKVASCFAKKGSTDLFKIANASGGVGGVTFNLENGTITNEDSGFEGEIENYGNGWFRCTAIDTLARSGTFSLGVTAASESIYIWGAQLESGYKTSYIPTSGSTVTRLQDAAFGAGSSDLISSTEGTLYAEIDIRSISSGTFLSLNDGSSSNRVIFGFISSTGKFFITGSGSTSNSQFPITTGQFNKIALTYKANERKVFVNGSSVYSSTSAFSMPTGLSELSFDSNGSGSQDFQGSVKSVAVFKEALTDAELTCLTTI